MRRFRISLLCLLLLSSVIPNVVGAVVATSTNYRIDRDSINFTGALSTSASYGLEDTGGEVGTGLGTSTNYLLNAGYQQNDGYISISSPSDVTLQPDIDGAAGGTAIGSTIWTVTTDNSAGYALSLKASTNSALQTSGASFADYTVAVASVPDYNWAVSSNASEFGFSPEGSAITSTYKDNGSACNVGALSSSDTCWNGFTTTDQIVASEAASNHPSGTATTIKFKAEAGRTANQAAGTYSARITATATAL